jgi:3-ketosteroid 9alpha-monooxygenase subunit A
MAKSAEYNLGKFDYPRGWFMIADSSELGRVPMSLRYFGRDLVLYRGDSGKPHLVEAYCPHMGTHLGINSTSYIVRDGEQIQGESIRCPYHGWRFNEAGQCDDIPYSPTFIPKSACLKTFPVVDRAGIIWTWHDAEGGAPDYPLPAFAEWDQEEDGWVRWIIDDLGVLDSHPIELLDNMVDLGHFIPIHGSKDLDYFENEFIGHIVHQRFGAGHRTLISDGNSALLELDTWYTGPAILQSQMQGEFPSRILITHTPIEDGRIHAWHALMVKVSDKRADADGIAMARAYQKADCLSLQQDVEIWANKRPCFNPMAIPADGPFAKVRLWYRQFYNARAEADTYHKRVDGVYVTRGTRRDPLKASA